MKQPLALRFDRIIRENLPSRKKMMSVLIDGALTSDIFHQKGMGVKSILKKIGRLTDFKGIYGFVEDGKVVYLDESSYVIKRLVRHYKGNSKYQKKLAHIIVETHQPNKPLFTVTDALIEMKEMQIIFLDIPDDLERHITTLYLQCEYECIYNRFE